MNATIKQSILLYVILTVLTGLVYPLAVTAIAQVVFPHQANGSLIIDKKDGTVLGSELLGQNFSEPKYFWGRLSATTPAYNAAASSGSNLGPSNETLFKNAQARIDALRGDGTSGGTSAAVATSDSTISNSFGRTSTAKIPIDLVTASGSGLDPDISVAAAQFQIARVAKARNISEDLIRELVNQQIQSRQLSMLGERRVNVLKLNILLDQLPSEKRTISQG